MRKVTELADTVLKWLEPGLAAVALNEIHWRIAEKLLRALQDFAPTYEIQKATSYSNSLLWRAPQ